MTPEQHSTPHAPHPTVHAASVLGWPAWLRVLAVLPVVLVLWLALAWAGGSPW